MMFNCPKCGALDHVLVSGGQFAGRILDGIVFRVEVSDERVYTVSVLPQYADFFSNFNEEKFLAQAREHAEVYDFAECPTIGCPEDIYLQPWLEEEYS